MCPHKKSHFEKTAVLKVITQKYVFLLIAEKYLSKGVSLELRTLLKNISFLNTCSGVYESHFMKTNFFICAVQ